MERGTTMSKPLPKSLLDILISQGFSDYPVEKYPVITFTVLQNGHEVFYMSVWGPYDLIDPTIKMLRVAYPKGGIETQISA